MTLNDVKNSQKDLTSLCADRPLKTNEIFSGNAFYGNDSILKTYAGLPPNCSLKVVIPHGPDLSENFIWIAEQKSPLPVIFYFSENRKKISINKTSKLATPAASPFLYLLELLKEQPYPERKGTIFFPSHSTHHVTTQMDFEGLAEELIQLDDEYHPITVCMYWRDITLGHHLHFKERGLRIVSAGHMFDPCFLSRFYHLCSLHQYAAGNSIGSHVFYSIKAGCSYFHLDSINYTQSIDSDIHKDDVGIIPSDLESKFKSLFSNPLPCATTEQLEFANYYLGTKFLKTPEELRRQLIHVEFLDKTGFLVCNSGYPKKLVLPPFFRPSRYYHIAQKIKDMCKNL